MKKGKNHDTLPDYVKKNPFIFPVLNSKEQVKTAWYRIDTYWPQMKRDAKIMAAYRAEKENENVHIANYVNEEEDLLVKSVLLLLGKRLGSPAPLSEVHEMITMHVQHVAWESTEPLDMGPLFPRCPIWHVEVTYCEARRWKTPQGDWKLDGDGRELVFCPRTRGICKTTIKGDLHGAHIHPIKDLHWTEWSLIEFFSSLDIYPRSRSLNENDLYLMKMAGWINRLNEIRERMKCEDCSKTLVPNNRYAFHPAAYNSTVAFCPFNHGDQIYFNHCWNCRRIIDSRESCIRHEGYYLCINCGSGPMPNNQRTSFKQGEICPKCSTPRMSKVHYHEQLMVCRNKTCGHQIHLNGRMERGRGLTSF